MTVLLDSMVVIDAHAGGWFRPLTLGVQIGVTSQVKFESTYYKVGTERVPIDLSDAINAGTVQLLTASNLELEKFVERTSLASRLGAGETESMALVLAHGHQFCTTDRLAMSAMKEVNVGEHWVALETVFLTIGLNTDGLDAKYRASYWGTA